MKFKAASGSDDSKNYVRLKDGESVTGVFTGEPYEFSKHWVVNRSELCTGENCELCKSTGKKGAFRFRLNLIIKTMEPGYVAKIFEQGWKTYKQLKSLNEEYPLEDTIVKITRQGTQLNDTSYTILPVKNPLVTPEIRTHFKDVKLFDLSQSEEETASDKPAATMASTPTLVEDDLPW